MSGEAMGWAMRHRTGDGSSAHVLLRLAMRADECGAMTLVDVDYIAEVCEISRATVFRCLKTLRDLGLLETETSFSRSGGRSVSARLLLDVTSVKPAMQETHGEAGAAESAGGEGSLKLRLPQDEVVSNLDEGSLNLRRPTLCLNSYNNNPPNPPDGEAAETGEREGDDLDGWFEAFQRSYPFDATMSLSEALAQGRKLSIKDRAKALRWAGEYAADVRKRGATRPLDAARWLRERRFDEIDRLKGGQAKAQGRERPMVHVAVGTRAWDAWIARGHKPGLNTSRHQGKTGWWFPTLWPPGCDPPEDEAGAA